MDPVNLVVKEPSSVAQRLKELGLNIETLQEALEAGLAERNACTTNDPPGFGGLVAWGRTVRRLRELLIPRDWRRTNSKRLAAVVSPEGTVVIAVSTGDERTGLDGASPQTRYEKGPAWVAAVEENNEQLDLPGMTPEDDYEDDQNDERLNRVTWVLMFYVDRNETRCELSMPRDMSPDGKLDAWVERILLPAISREPEPTVDESVPSAPIDVPVRRR